MPDPVLTDILARLAELRQQTAHQPVPPPPDRWQVNPTLTVVEAAYRGLPAALADPAAAVEEGSCLLGCWRAPDGNVQLAELANKELLALKLASEGEPPMAVAEREGVAAGLARTVLARARAKGLLLRPPSLLRRDPAVLPPDLDAGAAPYLQAEVFTLQWHLTQACDLHCRHCYDRSPRNLIPFSRAVAVLDELVAFCDAHHVHGQVSFTGGNPLLHPRFFDLYQAALDRGLMAAILGNPCDDETLDRILAPGRPVYYQVSLEGLEPHNDYIRGTGHFQRVLDFLPRLRARRIPALVMLTLSRANLEEVLPLAEHLRDRADLFTFNRLALFGEGARLAMADPTRFRRFLAEYATAAATNPVLGRKDNLLNLYYWQQYGSPEKLFGGCAGHGCGAAFNFLTLLPDGEVHACRKFPSPVGNILTTDLAAIYHGQAAHRYRLGPAACRGCAIRHVCGSCPAVTAGAGGDPARDRDPYCWLELHNG